MSKWRKITIGDLGKIVTGKTPSTKNENFWNGDIPFVTPSDLQKSKHVFFTERTVSQEGLTAVRGQVLSSGAICVSCIGNLGYTAMTTQVSVSNQQINSIIPSDDFDKNFIYYLMKSLWDEFKNLEGQSTTLSILNKTLFSKMEVIVPEVNTQKQIAKVLSSLDDKIELNTQINHNLEEQIRVLFEDFFINSQHCANWKQGTIADLGNVVGGSTPSKAKPEHYTSNGIAWITPKDLSGNKSKFISKGESDITPAGLRNSSAVIMPRGTVLFSSRAPIGYIAIAKNEITTNQGFKSVVPHLHIGTAFVYCFLKHNLPKIESMASGSTFKEVSGSVMKAIPAVIPAKEVLMNFSTITQPLFDQQELLESENQRLTRLRDALLPKLMSGEIDVSEVEI